MNTGKARVQIRASYSGFDFQNHRSADDFFLRTLLQELSDQASRKHYLVTGQVGLGKTLLLRRLFHAVDSREELARRYIPIILPEQYFEFSCADDFWAGCIRMLPDQITGFASAQGMAMKDRGEEQLPDLHDLKKLLRKQNQRLLLLVDNLHFLLQRFRHDRFNFLAALFRNPTVQVIATCHCGKQSQELKQALAKYPIQSYSLKNFSVSENHETIKQFAAERQAYHWLPFLNECPSRKKRLFALSGGNPRSTEAIARLVFLGFDNDLRTNLEQTLDQLSPLYQSKIDDLSVNGRKMIDLIAIQWHPLTESQIAKRLDLPAKAVRAELKRLNRLLACRKFSSRQRKIRAYSIRERLFNIWYLMRGNSNTKKRLSWLVRFLKLIFSQEELELQARKRLNAEPSDLREAEVFVALAQTLAKSALRQALEFHALNSRMIDDLQPRLFFQFCRISGSPERMHRKFDDIRRRRALRSRIMQVFADEMTARDAFCERLFGSPCLSETEKQGIELRAHQTTAEKWKILEHFLSGEARYWKKLLHNHTAPLYQAIASGEMTSLSDIAGVESVVEREQDPVLAAICWDAWLSINPAPKKNKIKLAERRFQQAITADPLIAILRVYLGKVLQFHLDQRDAAEQAYREAIAIDGNLSLAWNLLGGLLTTRPDRSNEAENAFRRAMNAEPQDSLAYNNLAWHLYTRHQKAEEAIRLAYDAVRLEPGNLPHLHTLATLLVADGNWATALPLIRRFIEGTNHEDDWELDHNGYMLFREIVETGRSKDAAKIVAELAHKNRFWLTMQHALELIGSADRKRIGEILASDQHPAGAILERLNTDLVQPVVDE